MTLFLQAGIVQPTPAFLALFASALTAGFRRPLAKRRFSTGIEAGTPRASCQAGKVIGDVQAEATATKKVPGSVRPFLGVAILLLRWVRCSPCHSNLTTLWRPLGRRAGQRRLGEPAPARTRTGTPTTQTPTLAQITKQKLCGEACQPLPTQTTAAVQPTRRPGRLPTPRTLLSGSSKPAHSLRIGAQHLVLPLLWLYCCF